jgi:hypothetical protein
MSIKEPLVIRHMAIGMVDQAANTYVLKGHKLLPPEMGMAQYGVQRGWNGEWQKTGHLRTCGTLEYIGHPIVEYLQFR